MPSFSHKINVDTRAKEFLPNIHRTQAPEITPGRDGMVPCVAAARCLQRAHTIRMLLSAFSGLVTFDLDIQTHPSEGQTRFPCKFDGNPFNGSGDI